MTNTEPDMKTIIVFVEVLSILELNTNDILLDFQWFCYVWLILLIWLQLNQVREEKREKS